MMSTVRLGAFVLTALLMLAAAVFLIGRRQSLFQSTYQVKANFSTVAGLMEGADVRVGGVHQGSVKRIELPHKSTDKVIVTMALYPGTRNVVKKDSVAAIQSEGLLGDMFVEIYFGSAESQSVQNGDEIQSKPPFEMSDLMRKADAILDSTKKVAENAESTTSNLKSVTGKINEGQGTIGALIQDKKMYNDANAGVVSFRDNMDALKHNFLLRGYFNKRGYQDAEELSKNGIQKLPNEKQDREFVLDAKQLFDKDNNAKLKNQKKLDEAGRFLQQNPFGLAVVKTTAGETGETDKLLKLTEARSVAIRKYLVENFKLDDTRVKTLGAGKTRETGAAANQVEILVYADRSKSSAVRSNQARQ